MKRALCAAVLAVAAVSAPAAADPISVDAPASVVTVWNDGHRTGVGTGIPGQPLLSVWVDHDGDRACAGFSKQIPLCMPLHSS